MNRTIKSILWAIVAFALIMLGIGLVISFKALSEIG